MSVRAYLWANRPVRFPLCVTPLLWYGLFHKQPRPGCPGPGRGQLLSMQHKASTDMGALLCRSGIKLTREIAQQPALAGVTKGELHPGAAKQSDSEIDAFIRDTVHSGRRSDHPPCSARLGSAHTCPF